MNPTLSEISAYKIGDCRAALIALLPKFDELGRVAYHHQGTRFAHLSQQVLVDLPNWLEILLGAAPLTVLGFDR